LLCTRVRVGLARWDSNQRPPPSQRPVRIRITVTHAPKALCDRSLFRIEHCSSLCSFLCCQSLSGTALTRRSRGPNGTLGSEKSMRTKQVDLRPRRCAAPTRPAADPHAAPR
jgi:hypothetical protein